LGIFESNSGDDAVLMFSLAAGAAVAGELVEDELFAVVLGEGAEFICEFWLSHDANPTTEIAIVANKRCFLERNPDIVTLSQFKLSQLWG